ncbi:MAG: magnesium/cobalt transporter CorA [Chloroflexi bacterium]|nr:magnesium/cobalt transporter CorA [Chloroflexota bacterium]MDA0245478.1 magnesium/cobalt transporter CorA [Chloroflexota bacterium]
MIRIFLRTPDGQRHANPSIEFIPAALAQKGALLWVDFQAEPPSTCEPILLNTFGFHPLAVDDALSEIHVPRVDDWSEYLFVVLSTFSIDMSDHNSHLEIQELDVFLGHNYLVTHHDEPIASVDRTWTAVQRDERHAGMGPDHLLYRLVDDLVNSFMPIVEEIDIAIDEVEDSIFNEPRPQTLSRIFTLKRILLQMRRILTPQREVLNKLARDDYPVIDAPDRIFFRDVYDHLVRLHDINESLRDLVSGTLDVYLSVVNNRMNDVMKILTVITTLFMPISFLAGFFGMNFFEPTIAFEGWTGATTFAITLIIMISSPIAMYFWIQKRGWL